MIEAGSSVQESEETAPMFKPEEIIFAPTAECNLACAHCRVKRISQRLPAEEAIKFLKSGRLHGIEKVGFSGGEPFLRPDFLCEVSRAAVEQEMTFDRLMTNGVWFESPKDLKATLAALHEAGFDGTFGVSVDAYHAQDLSRLSIFFRAVFSIWRRRDCCEIISVKTPEREASTVLMKSLADRLNGRLLLQDGEPFSIVNQAFLDQSPSRKSLDISPWRNSRFPAPGTGDPTPAIKRTRKRKSVELRRDGASDASEAMVINIIRVPYSAAAEENAWDSQTWFKNDFCRGPGNVFYVHPDGRVAVCCGFANENPKAIIGNIHRDGYKGLMRSAAKNPLVTACYKTGLATFRKSLESRGHRFPGKTDDPCFFCDYCAKHELFGSRHLS